MRLIAMRATFGCLDGAELHLEPGLNRMTMPNESGKSTWCAFLTAMLYGIDTAQRAARGRLPEKQRYVPWNGKPMEGIVELEHHGRTLVLQRTSVRGRPLGEFRAWDKATGLDVPELTGDNCGQLLLGVERSVFERSALLRGSDLTVTQDRDLSRRLGDLALGGSGEDSYVAASARLRQWQNRLRYHQSGLIPETENRLDALHQEQAARELSPDRPCPPALKGLAAGELLARAQADGARLRRLQARWPAVTAGLLLAAAGILSLSLPWAAAGAGLAAFLCLAVYIFRRRTARALLAAYDAGTADELLQRAVCQRELLLRGPDRRENIARLEARLTQLLRREQAISLAREALDQANRQLEQVYAPALTRQAGDYCRQLTLGRYDAMTLSPELTLSLREASSGLTRPLASLSRGTQDLAWLSLRLAMADLLLPPDAPLLLDDALLTLDGDRAAAAVDVLSRTRRQVLLLSCRE